MNSRRIEVDAWLVALGTVLLAVWSVFWIRYGADTADGGFAVGIQLRVAEGDLPFVDEQSLLVLGALPGVPFVWLWHQLFGLDGIVLAARVAFLLVAAATCLVAYRALRTAVAPSAAFAGVVIAALALPYDIPVLSYNTVPVLCSLLSGAALVATVETGHRRWAIVSGAALGVAAASNPQYLPAGLVLGVVALVFLARSLWVPLLAAAATPLVALGLWIVLVPGVSSFLNSLRYMQEARDVLIPGHVRLGHNLENLASQLLVPSYLVVLSGGALVALGLVLRPSSPYPRLGLAVLPLAASLPVLRMALRTLPVDVTSAMTETGEIGVTTMHASAAAVSVLIVPALVWLTRDRRRSLIVVSTYAAGLALVVTPVVASSTASAPARGIAAAGFTVPLLIVTVIAIEAIAPLRVRIAGPLAALAAVAAMAAVASATVFPLIPVRDYDVAIRSGAWAGMQARQLDVERIREMTGLLESNVDDNSRVLGVAAPALPLFSDVRQGAPMLWFSFAGDANRRGVEWLAQPAHTPEFALVFGYDALAFADDPVLRDDQLAQFIRDNYTVIESVAEPSPMTLLRHDDD